MTSESQRVKRMDPDLRIGLSLVAIAALGVAFCALVLAAYAAGPVEQLDVRILNWLSRLDGSGFPSWKLASSADLAPLLAMLGILTVAGLAMKRREQVAAALLLVAGANVTAQLLKVLLAHPRMQPFGAAGTEIGPAALPSGHATASASLAAAAILVSPNRFRPLATLAGLAYAAAVGTAVVVLHWHLPSDVLGGWMVVASWTLLAGIGLSSAELRARRNSRETTDWRASRGLQRGRGPSPSGSS